MAADHGDECDVLECPEARSIAVWHNKGCRYTNYYVYFRQGDHPCDMSLNINIMPSIPQNETVFQKYIKGNIILPLWADL